MLVASYSAETLTPESVTTMLRSSGRFSDVVVDGVTVSPIGTGQMAASYRLDLTYAASSDEDAPRSVIAKVASTDETSRQMALATAAYRREVLFYQRLSADVGARTPVCYFADIADGDVGFIALLEDLGPARTLDQLGGCDADQASLAIGQAAALHGSSWHRDYLGQEWLPVEAVWNMLGAAIPQVAGPWLERFGDFLEPEHVSAITRLGSEVGTWLETLRNHRTLWHGDFRLDNLLFDARDGAVPVAVVDWQSVAAAPGIIDVAYFLGNSMVEAERIKHERDLVSDYHDRLLSHGVENYSFDECWREYQAHALFGLVLTIPVSMSVQATERGDAMFGAMARRAADQINANDSYAALQAL